MTDKQIIIDETKCPWFNDGSCDLFYSDKEECWYRKCKDTPNCYYRETQTQLKRKEQECEELKAKFQDMKKSRDIALKEYNEEFEYKRQITVEHLEQKKELLKQLDQLKAELTRANCQIADDEILQCDMREAIEKLKAENCELKEEIAKAKMEICNQCGEKDDYNIPCKQIRDLDYGLQLEIEENEKLKQILTEIKEIAKPFCEECKEFDDLHKERDCMYCNYGKILQKISEVEDEV